MTAPSAGAVISFSIFMASRTSNESPASTSSPAATESLTMVPCIGAEMMPSPDSVVGPEALREGGRRRWAPGPPGAGSGAQNFTEKRRPPTSTVMFRSASASSSGTASAGATVMSLRSTSSSTHFV